MVGGQTQVFGSSDQGKICSMGGQQTVRGRVYEDGFQEKAF